MEATMSANFVVSNVTVRVECLVRPKKKTKLGVDGDLSREQFSLHEISHEAPAVLGTSNALGTPILGVKPSTSGQPRDWFVDTTVFTFKVDDDLEVVPHTQWVKLRFQVEHDGQVLTDTIGYEIDAAQPEEEFHANEPHEFTLVRVDGSLQLVFPSDGGGGAVAACADLRAALVAVPPASWQADLYRVACVIAGC
jgi:hypothetical protein